MIAVRITMYGLSMLVVRTKQVSSEYYYVWTKYASNED